MDRKVSLCGLLLLLCINAYGQLEQYHYKRELPGVQDTWHRIVLPNEIFAKVSQQLSDIRIFGITADNDIIEAPYLLRLATGKTSEKEVDFTLINQSRKKNGYYFTFEVPSEDPINRLILDFEQQNFDWQLTLKGSQDQQEWFTLVDDYRILSFKNDLTNYKFTKVSFPAARFGFFRLRIDAEEKPGLTAASIKLIEKTEGKLREYKIKTKKVTQVEQTQQTVIDIELKTPVPVSQVEVGVMENFDYYRPLAIQYVTDSLKTEQGWRYSYRRLGSGTLSSLEQNVFEFNNTLLQKLRITIHNHDNIHLTPDAITIKGYLHELIARFTEPARYYLAYNQQKASRPNYDLSYFEDRITDSLTTLTLGEEEEIVRKRERIKEPLFENKAWLWGIMTVIILVLGGFSIRMIKSR